MIARANLGKNMNVLQTSLQRLSTGFKINSGKDDPAGLIASEMLRSDITGIKMAIRNTERANMMIATADSALNEVTNLLNDIRGLVTEAASTGTMSKEMIYANQLQVDASLDAIDRIAAQTTFMGKKLLDGSLDFNLVGIDRNNLKGLAVNQVTFGADKSPMDVTISVRDAAEKAALYYNQPGLAEAIVLQWGGNYGFDMETFEKGATVAEIAEIINGRADGTGVIAEVGSDALAGLLYVSGLGYDNDMIIRAGLAGLNEGNVEIKYLKGGSDGIQVRYEEPLFPGAPAKILVYLQTEAYNAAFADDIDTSWVMQNGKLVPMRDNNALKFETNIQGAQYNNSGIHYVDGSLTDPRFYDPLTNPTGTAGMPYAYYSDSGETAKALFGYVPGSSPTMGVNDTGLAFSNLLAGEYFAVQARATGTQYNNVSVQFVAAAKDNPVFGGDPESVGGRRAAAHYNEQTDAYGNVIGKTLTIYYYNDGKTTLDDVQKALNVQGDFTISPQIGTKKLSDIELVGPTNQTVRSNTHNSGGAPGTLFIVMPPDGKMPARPDIDEMPGVTARAIGDGLYLAHKDTAWDNVTFAFTHNKTTPGNSVIVSYDSSTKTLNITVPGQATYDDILAAINGDGWLGGKPDEYKADQLYWSDANGIPRVAGVPRALPTQLIDASVSGRSNRPVGLINGQPVYLHHDHTNLDDWTVQFVLNDSLPGKTTSVMGDASARTIIVNYSKYSTYTDILDALNGTWSGKPSPGKFTWIDVDGTPLMGNNTPAALSAQITPTAFAPDVRLAHNDSMWNGYSINFDPTGSATPLVTFNGTIINVNYDPATATFGDIISAINGSKPMVGMKDLTWAGGDVPALATNFASVVPVPVPAGRTITLGSTSVPGASTDNRPGSTLATVSTGKIVTRTGTIIGDTYYLAHSHPQWDGIKFNFHRSEATGGSVRVEFDGINLDIYVDSDTTYEDILDSLNYPNGRPAFPNPGSDPDKPHPLSQWLLTGDAAASALASNVDSRNEIIVGSGTYLNHNNNLFNGWSIIFDASGTGAITHTANEDSKTITIRYEAGATTNADMQTYLTGGSITVGTLGDPGLDWGGVSPIGIDQFAATGNVKLGNIGYPTITHPMPGPLADITKWDGLWWVSSTGSRAIPGVPTTLVTSTDSGKFRPLQYSADGRSEKIATLPSGVDLYIHHTDKSWDNLDIVFASTGTTHIGVAPPVRITFDGTTVNVMIDTNATYDDILMALNSPLGNVPGSAFADKLSAALADPLEPENAAWLEKWTDGFPTYVPFDLRWAKPDGTGYPPIATLPKAGDLRWVDSNGMITTVTNPIAGSTGRVDAAINLAITHLDPKWDGYSFTFITGSPSPGDIEISSVGKSVQVLYDPAAGLTYDDILAALNGSWSGKPIGIGKLSWEILAGGPITDTATDTVVGALGGVNATLGKVTYANKFAEPIPALMGTIKSGAVIRDITANDIAAIFDLGSNMSRGSERAASLFTVSTTVDNDGTGLMRLYNYWIDSNGNIVDPYSVDPAIHTQILTKTAFEKAFQGGVSGGEVITTAAELVTALNNSAYWGTIMCPELIAELAKENVQGKFYDLSNPPVITASLAPGNHGLFAVTPFEEVAYYGNPNEGTALQFLGGYNSPNIRFVVDGPNSQLYGDRTTVPAVLGHSQAVLTAQDSGASLTITSLLKGGEYDDVQFVFKRIDEDSQGLLAPDRKDGWVEYDPGSSFAFAQATFKDATTNSPVTNSAFYITSTERGDMYNNVEIMMRLDDYATGSDPVTVTFDPKTNQMRISIDSSKVGSVTTNDIINAINKASAVPFKAELSYSEDPLNTGMGTFANVGLSAGRYTSIGNTKNTGGHQGGTVTVWLADPNPGPGGPAEMDIYRHPTQDQVVRLLNNDPIVSRMFTAKAYNSVQQSDGKQIDFVKDGPIVTSGGLIEPAVITVHLATDHVGNVTTTAADLVKWWNAQDPALIDGISASVVRPPGAVWDECADPYGKGILAPSVEKGECGEWIINDIQFVGWNDNTEQQHFVAKYSTGIMTSQRGINSSFQMTAKNLGPEWDGFTIEYINDNSVTGRFADNLVAGSGINPCDYDPYTGLLRDDCGNLISPNSTTENGLRLFYDEAAKKIVINLRFGITTANDVQQLINSDPRTRNKFEITQLGNGTGLVDRDDNTLLTKDGATPPGELNGAKLLFGSDATDYYLIFRSREYGSDQFVDVQARAVDGGSTTFTVADESGKTVERAFGKDVDALVNGISAVGTGLNVSLNTAGLSLNFGFSEFAGTAAGYSTHFTINGGGATFQVGPDVVSRQQITMGIRSINTVQLGGSTGVLAQLRSGQDADLSTDTNKAFRIVEESLLAITSIRGRLGTMQRATLETNINVLNDTLTAITEAESQIRDTDFAEETSNLTRAQILVQANMNTLGIANQIPNYMLSLLGR